MHCSSLGEWAGELKERNHLLPPCCAAACRLLRPSVLRAHPDPAGRHLNWTCQRFGFGPSATCCTILVRPLSLSVHCRVHDTCFPGQNTVGDLLKQLHLRHTRCAVDVPEDLSTSVGWLW